MLFDEAAVRAGDGTRLFYRIAGAGSTTLLFLHGWGGSGSGAFWDRTLQHLDPTGLRLVLADCVVTVGRNTPATVLPPSASLKTCSKWSTEWSVAPDGRFLLATPVSAMPTLMVTLLVDWPTLVH